MTTLGIVLLLCRIAGLVFGLLAAFYWFKAGKVKVTDKDTRYDPRFDFVVNNPEDKERDTNFSQRSWSRADLTGLLLSIPRLPFSSRRQHQAR
jgi:hypothetical protein